METGFLPSSMGFYGRNSNSKFKQSSENDAMWFCKHILALK